MKLLRAIFFTAFIATSALAESAADALVDTMPSPDEPKKEKVHGKSQGTAAPIGVVAFDLNDPVLALFYAEYRSLPGLPFEVHQWAQEVLQRHFEQASHLWTVVKRQLPPNFVDAATVANLYGLWNLGVSQTFFDQWMANLSKEGFSKSPLHQALVAKIGPGFDSWATKNALTLDGEALALAKRATTMGEPYDTVRALAALRTGEAALKVASTLPDSHKLKIPLIQTAVLSLARKNDIKGAASVLKKELEPALDAQQDPKQLSQYYLQIARLLYQAGKLQVAEQFYLKIPKGSEHYIAAQQELGWVWLRLGQTEKVRGLVTSLAQPVYEEDFQPERLVVASISNLKLCYYDKVEQNIREFITEGKAWGKKIDESLASADPKVPHSDDFYSVWLDNAVASRTAESKRLAELLQFSITAALPAVGTQSHWENAEKHILTRLEDLKKRRAEEAHRQWQNRKVMLTEAMRKMRFVKVELLSQVAQYSQSKTLIAQAPSDNATLSDQGSLKFPFDGVVWPDELFSLRGLAQAKCLKREKP